MTQEKTEKIIDDLEEEFAKVDFPIMDKLTLFAKVTNAIYKCAEQEPKTDILDKIRAEIMSEIVWHIDQQQEDCAQVLTSAIEIIDKYRKEG